MAKVTLMEPYGSISGMICKHYGVVNANRLGEQILYRRHNNPDPADATQAQKDVRDDFKTVQASVKSAGLTSFSAAFKANPEGYKTLNNYAFGKEWARLKAAGSLNTK